MTLTKKELLSLQEEVEDSKTTVSELKGQQTALLAQLKAEFGCDTIEKAEAKLEEINNSITSLEKKIKKGSEELEQQLEAG